MIFIEFFGAFFIGDGGKIETEKSSDDPNNNDDGENIWDDEVTNKPPNENQEDGTTDQPRTGKIFFMESNFEAFSFMKKF